LIDLRLETVDLEPCKAQRKAQPYRFKPYERGSDRQGSWKAKSKAFFASFLEGKTSAEFVQFQNALSPVLSAVSEHLSLFFL
jgi:hypothetical protein